ncbi:hypothetical protein V6N12_028712 [Hibiscus sabdariffa]|uniref:GOLD domain-containing protein n=1 Tax=Hibiscus sabdariffa TaxID=183260 RepID=A0ABR2F6M4_9ROSI
MAVEAKVEESAAQEHPNKVAEECGNGVLSQPKTVEIEKSSSYREESDFLSDLKEFEKKALFGLKSKIEQAILGNSLLKKDGSVKQEEDIPKGGKESDGSLVAEGEAKLEDETTRFDKDVSLWGVPLLPSKGGEATDVVLLKFLRAREFKVNDAFEMLRNTLQWREDGNIDSVLDQEFGADLGSAAYMNGIDKEGHPICYNIYGVFADEELYNTTFGTEEKRGHFLRWRFQLMEKGIRKLDLRPGGVTSLLQINDLKNSPGPSRKELRIAMKQAVGALQDNYPEFVARNVTETLLKYIPAEEIPVQYGGFKRENDFEFSGQDAAVSEITVKAGSTVTIEIPAQEIGSTLMWELMVLSWEVHYKAEFVPSDEGSYTIIVQKSKKMVSQSQEAGPIRSTFINNETGKLVLSIDNTSSKKKRLLYRYKTIKSSSF